MFDLETEFDKLNNNNWKNITTDQSLPFPAADLLIKKYSDPKGNDKIMQINDQLSQTKEIMVNNIEKILQRGEKIDDLVK
jgi:hypothetical protein